MAIIAGDILLVGIKSRLILCQFFNRPHMSSSRLLAFLSVCIKLFATVWPWLMGALRRPENKINAGSSCSIYLYKESSDVNSGQILDKVWCGKLQITSSTPCNYVSCSFFMVTVSDKFCCVLQLLDWRRFGSVHAAFEPPARQHGRRPGDTASKGIVWTGRCWQVSHPIGKLPCWNNPFVMFNLS